jgi:hypothetical protein
MLIFNPRYYSGVRKLFSDLIMYHSPVGNDNPDAKREQRCHREDMRKIRERLRASTRSSS